MKICNSFYLATLALLLVTTACAQNRPDRDARAVLDAIASRTSIRAYTPAAVGADTVELLLRAAMAAPSARNKQPWAFVVVDDRARLASLSEQLPYAKMLKSAPLAIVVCGDPEMSGDWWVQDCSAATENLLLAAHAVGLGAVWTGAYPGTERVDAIRSALNIPSPHLPLNVIVIGYPAQQPEPKQKWDPAKVHYNSFSAE